MNFNNHGLIIPDVSFYQDDDQTPQKIDFAKMKAAGAVGVILRGGQNTWVDEDFADYRRDAKAAGLPRGYYWFYDSRIDPGKQANIWRAAIGDDLPEMGLWFDFEDSYHGAYHGEKYWKQFVLAMAAFFPNVELHGVYTARWYWDSQSVSDPLFWGRYPLWVAQYGVGQADVVLPRPWLGKEPLFWQFTAHGDGTKYGVESKNIDLNYFNGDADTFRTYFGLGIPDDGEEEGTMYRYEAINTYGMSLRPVANVNNTPITTIPAQSRMQGDVLEGTQGSGECWLAVKAVNNMTLAVAGWVAIEHGGRVYCSLIDNGPTPDPQPVYPPRIGYTLDGVTIKWYVPE